MSDVPQLEPVAQKTRKQKTIIEVVVLVNQGSAPAHSFTIEAPQGAEIVFRVFSKEVDA